MVLINDKGGLTIDLFHGTSTLFADSIIKHGLGGVITQFLSGSYCN